MVSGGKSVQGVGKGSVVEKLSSMKPEQLGMLNPAQVAKAFLQFEVADKSGSKFAATGNATQGTGLFKASSSAYLNDARTNMNARTAELLEKWYNNPATQGFACQVLAKIVDIAQGGEANS